MSEQEAEDKPSVLRECCLKNPGGGSCPYQSEINGDDSDCSCCDDCRHQCAMDI